MEYSGYWLYNEEIEKHWPKQQRLKRDGSKQITQEALQDVIRRAADRAKPIDPSIRATETKESSS